MTHDIFDPLELISLTTDIYVDDSVNYQATEVFSVSNEPENMTKTRKLLYEYLNVTWQQSLQDFLNFGVHISL